MAHTAESLAEAFGYLSGGEVALLKKLVRSLPADPLVINIGAGPGTSGLAILEAREDAFLITIDNRDEAHPFGGLENERTILKERLDLAGRHAQIHGDSAVTGRLWNREAPAFVFVDGDHSYEGVKADIEAWLPKTISIIAFHDLDRKNHEGIRQAIEEVFNMSEAISHVDTMIAFRAKKKVIKVEHI